MQENKKTLSIVVTGDVTVDWNIAHRSHELLEPTEWTGEANCTMNWQYGSAALLSELVVSLAGKMREVANVTVKEAETVSNAASYPSEQQIVHSYTVWAPFEEKQECEKEKKIRWRVKRFLGLDRLPENTPESIPPITDAGETAPPDIVVIDDSNLGFREHPERWPLDFSNSPSGTSTPWIVVKMSAPVAKGDLWKRLTSAYTDRLVIIVNIDDLRQTAIRVSSRISWEQTAEELTWELEHNPEINGLLNSACCIVSFGMTGALLIPGRHRHDERPKLLFDPLFMEGEWAAGNGMMIGKTSTLVAGIVQALMQDTEKPDFVQGIQSGVDAMRVLQQHGYEAGNGLSIRLRFPTEKVIETLLRSDAPLAVADIPAENKEKSDRRSTWTILRDKYHNELQALSREIVLKGVKTSLKQVPLAVFGRLVTVDRHEIESLRSVANLITEYCRRGESRPVSIAVFGQPGSGKSFAVKEIASVVDSHCIADKTLTFNLSQFNDPDELNDAFHQVRDIGLSGKIPLVFWDEFDSRLNGNELGWLRYFLSPMQDGAFQEGQLTHPIGKAIFVFAGGTSHSFDLFKTKPVLPDAKVPDFLSRLKGFLNISGPDRHVTNGVDDPYFIVRRAMLLRSLFERLTPQLFENGRSLRIDTGVLRAFLEIDRYEHGARSMESIIAMSKLGDATSFTRSALPPEEQLNLHVKPEAFMSLVHKLELEGQTLETFAKLNHDLFCKHLKTDGYEWGERTDEHANPKTHSSLVPFEKLSEHEQEQNRGAVRDFPDKLKTFGYVMIPKRKHEPAFEFPDAVLDEMARLEHKRWKEAKEQQGWQYAAITDKPKKQHALLVDWDELPDDEKEKNRKIIAAMTDILDNAGYTIVRLPEKRTP